MRDLSRVPYQCPENMQKVWAAVEQKAIEYFDQNNLKVIRHELRENGIHFHVKHPVKGNVMSFRAGTTSLMKFEYIGTKSATWKHIHVMNINLKKESRLNELEAAIHKK